MVTNDDFFQIHIYTEGPEILEKYFDKKILPRDYGGEEQPSEKIQGTVYQIHANVRIKQIVARKFLFFKERF